MKAATEIGEVEDWSGQKKAGLTLEENGHWIKAFGERAFEPLRQRFEDASPSDRSILLRRFPEIRSELAARYVGELIRRENSLQGPAIVALLEMEGGEEVLARLPEGILLRSLVTGLPLFGYRWTYRNQKQTVVRLLSKSPDASLSFLRKVAPDILLDSASLEPLVDIFAALGGREEILSMMSVYPDIGVQNQGKIIKAIRETWLRNRSKLDRAEIGGLLINCVKETNSSLVLRELAITLGLIGDVNALTVLQSAVSRATPHAAGVILKAIEDIRTRSQSR